MSMERANRWINIEVLETDEIAELLGDPTRWGVTPHELFCKDGLECDVCVSIRRFRD